MSFPRTSAFAFSALVALASSLAVGCTDAAADSNDSTAGEQDLTAAASKLVGTLIPAVGIPEEAPIEGFQQLLLADDGTFYGSFLPHGICTDETTGCIPGPDREPVQGTWKTRRYQSKVRLYLTFDGATVRYDAKRENDLLTLDDGKGGVQTLERDLCSDVVCAATMTCSGGVCVEPEPTPGGVQCGEVQCSAGTVCCNPLDGICVSEGEVCTL